MGIEMTVWEKLPASVLEEMAEPDKNQIRQEFLKEWNTFDRKTVVLDDDPTGVQTVHGVSVYTDWEEESLMSGMLEDNKLFFVLTNSRSFTEQETKTAHTEIAEHILSAARKTGRRVLIVSRGDSTLRGHYPLELEVLREVLEKEHKKAVDGQILCPFFLEGGRYTIESVHYVKEGDFLIPAGETEFARDKTFGYRASGLGEYVEEKSGGRYPAETGIYITLPMLRALDYEKITGLLMQAENFQPILVDAICESDIEVFVTCLIRAMKAGKEYLIRSAAAIPKVLGNISDRKLLTREELVEQSGYGGIVLVGSHVQKTTRQLSELKHSAVAAEYLEFNVNAYFTEGGLCKETERIIAEAERVMEEGKTAVVYTSRTLLAPEKLSKEETLQLSVQISAAVTAVIGGLHRKPGFILAKGGITSSDVGTKAIRVKKALVLGQVQPGIPVWKTGAESKFPDMSYIIFPGNVGDDSTLRKIVETLTEHTDIG